MSPKKTTEEFIEQAKRLHPNYDYSQVVYEGNKKKVVIFCDKGHRFLQTPNHHLRGEDCPFCLKCAKVTLESFKERATEIHKGKYDYSLVDFKTTSEKVKIICPVHGVFEQVVESHIMGYGCRKCGRDCIRVTDEKMRERLTKAYGDRYDFSISKWNGRESKIDFICPKHGVVQAQLRNLLKKRSFGCPKCYHDSTRLTMEEFLERAKEMHGDDFDYSEVEYVNATTEITLTCKKNGHRFKTRPDDFLYRNQGCPVCHREKKSKGERELRWMLVQYGVEFEEQKTFPGCKYKQALQFDFYIPSENTCIEYQGPQHYSPINEADEEEFRIRQIRDAIKRDYCAKHGVKLLEIKYNERIQEKMVEAFPHLFPKGKLKRFDKRRV